MNTILILLLIFCAVFVVYTVIFISKSSKVNNNTVVVFTGGLGSGKTFLGVKTAIKSYRKALFKWRFNKIFSIKKRNCEKPLLFSNIPINYGRFIKRKYSEKLIAEHLLMYFKIPENSVVFIDEVGQFASQNDYNNQVITDLLQEFIRFFRHYVNGRLIMTDQSNSNIVVQIRRRVNVVYNLLDFKKVTFGFFYKISFFKMISAEDNLQNNNNVNSDESPYFCGLLPLFSKNYESRCYKKNYNPIVKNYINKPFDNFYSNYFIDLNYHFDKSNSYSREKVYKMFEEKYNQYKEDSKKS